MKPLLSDFSNRIPILILLGSVLFFFLTATYELSYPGLHYDETLFVPSMLGDTSGAYRRWGDFPILLMPYIGALKTFIYLPIFKLFGSSVLTYRLPAILISCITIVVSFQLGKLLFNPWMASLIAVFMATDPAFIYHTRMDFGPMVLMSFFKILSLLLFFKLVLQSSHSSAKSIRLIWLLGLVMLLGLYDKLNYIWFIVAFTVSSLIVYRKNIYQVIRTCSWKIWFPITFFTTTFGLIIYFLILPILSLGHDSPNVSSSNFSLVERWLRIFYLSKYTADGSAFYNLIFQQHLSQSSKILTVTVMLAALTSILLLIRLFYSQFNFKRYQLHSTNDIKSNLSSWFYFLLLTVVIFVQLLTTRQAGGSHHAIMLFPFYHFFNIASICLIFQLTNLKDFKLMKYIKIGLLSFLTATLVLSQIQVCQAYSTKLREKTSFNYLMSPAIYQLSEYLENKESEYDKIIAVDWGFNHQLLLLSSHHDKNTKYSDLWSSFSSYDDLSPEQKEHLANAFFKEKRNLIVSHTQETETLPNTRTNWLKFSSNYLDGVKLEKHFTNVDGQEIYEVYSSNPY